jgi:hypothetical protein
VPDQAAVDDEELSIKMPGERESGKLKVAGLREALEAISVVLTGNAGGGVEPPRVAPAADA